MTSMSNFTGGRNEKNINPCTVLIAGTLLLLCCIALVSRIQNLNTEQDFDVLIFTQRWPNTACLEWEEKTKPPHNCTFPRKGGHWVIHGIWPTKLGTKGPNFCNSTLPFNVTALNPIRSDLDEYWTDIEIGSKHKNNSFWKHEWLKHGTCASSIESLNTEIKYFQQALKWRQEYSMQEVLSLMHIKPTGESHGYNVDEFVKAVNDAIGKNPFIGCIHDTKTGLPFLSEIRICFDKNLLLTDCDGIKVKGTNPRSWHTSSVLTNCPQNKLIIYPSEVPPRDRQLLPRHEHYLVHLYKMLTFLQWFTS